MFHLAHLLPLFAFFQTAASTPPLGSAPNASSGAAFVPSAIAAGAGCAYFMNALKNWQKLPYITQHSAAINRVVRAVTSFVSVVGITFVWSGTAGTLTIGGLHAAGIFAGAAHWFSTYAIQQGWENVFSIKPTNGSSASPVPAAVPETGK